jgi:hypothetical protein
MSIRKALDNRVRLRARQRCEYCHLPQACYLLRFQLDHIIAEQHGGKTKLKNLCLACPRCNTKKVPNIAGRGNRAGEVVRLYNPRTDIWTDHFQWVNAKLRAVSHIGRVTIVVLDMNEPSAIEFRRELMVFWFSVNWKRGPVE